MNETHLRAVFLMLAGRSVASVSEEFKICRTSLYKLRRRARDAVRREIERPTKNRNPAPNRTSQERENKIVRLCQRHTSLSSYRISQKFEQAENETINPRTVQRIRKRHSLPRVPQRQTPAFKAHRFTAGEKDFVRRYIKEKLYLGGERLAWDIRNRYKIDISPSTAKRIKQSILLEINPPPPKPNWRFYERKHPHSLWHGDYFEKVTLTDENRTAYQLALMDDYSRAYVYCDLLREPTQNDTVRALITAMRRYETIPKAVIFDNGSQFKGSLLRAFCFNLGIRLIHTSVGHPQTNGKLERAFRDDRREYYDRFERWIFDELRAGLPAYVRYRNEIRGHRALGGKPSRTRLDEQDRFALPSVLNRLESFARQPFGSASVGLNRCIRVLGRNGYIPNLRCGQKIDLIETLDGLEAKTEDGRLYLLKNYRKLRQAQQSWRGEQLPFSFDFEEYGEAFCARTAVAL